MQNRYKHVAVLLAEQINQGRYAPGEKLPSEQLLCIEYDVKRTTIRRALAALAEDGMIIKRPGIGSIVADRKRPMIALVASTAHDNVRSLSHHFISPVYEAFSTLCADAGYCSVSMQIAGVANLDRFAELAASSVGLVLCDNIQPEYLDYVAAHRYPCVLMSQRASGFRSVLCDNDGGLALAVGHLAALGHRRIAYIGGERAFLNARARAAGFRSAMNALLPDAPNIPVQFCGWNVRDGAAATEALLDAHPKISAICAVNDAVACGAVRAIRARGLRVPKDIAVIGFGNTVDPDTAELPLTTVGVSFARMAEELWHALALEMKKPHTAPATVLVETDLIVRDTTVLSRKEL